MAPGRDRHRRARSDAAAIASLNECHRWSWDECNAIVDVIETRAATPRDVLDIHEAFGAETVVYVELPLGEDPAPFVEQLARLGRRAKLRTGGVTADAIPPVEAVLGFMQACVQAGVPFKATAGLHHVVRGDHALTYEADAPTAPMYGFLNIFMGAALLAIGAPADTVREALLEGDATASCASRPKRCTGATWPSTAHDWRMCASMWPCRSAPAPSASRWPKCAPRGRGERRSGAHARLARSAGRDARSRATQLGGVGQ